MKYSYYVHEANGVTAHYYYNNLLHREDGPALHFWPGEMWYYMGKAHRTGGPAISFSNGDQHWYRHGKYHRLFGPAVIWGHSGNKEWHIFGKLIWWSGRLQNHNF